MELIRLKTLFEFGQGKGIIEPIARSRTWRAMYWYLIAFGVLFWIALLWFSYYFPGSYGE